MSLSNCKVTRPDQENYVFDGRQAPVGVFVQSLRDHFNGSVQKTDFQTIDDEQNVLYEIASSKGNITIMSLPDDWNRCTSNASTDLTFHQQLYEVDLVFNSRSPAQRETARRTLLRSAQQVGAKLQKLYECP